MTKKKAPPAHKYPSKATAGNVARKTGISENSEAKSEAQKRKLANLKPFQPGQSGNPGGRPKKLISDAYRLVLEQQATYGKQKGTGAELLAAKMWRQAMSGKIQAATEITDRVEGKAMQAVQMSGPGGGAIPLTSMSPEENERRIAELLAKGGM